MKQLIFKRWLMFFLVALPIQLLIYAIYPLAVLYFRFFVKGKVAGAKQINLFNFPKHHPNLDWLENFPRQARPTLKANGLLLLNPDQHGALIHYGLFYYQSKEKAQAAIGELIGADGVIKRIDEGPWINPTSRDCLSALTFSIARYGVVDSDLKRVTNHFIKYCFGFYDMGVVSTRNSCAGVVSCGDGAFGLGQPQFGPAFYAASSLLRLASKRFGGVYSIVYILHYILMGGWLWWVEPIIHTEDNLLYYDHHTTALALCALKGQLGVKQAARRIYKISPYNNVDGIVQGLLADCGALNTKEIQLAGEALLRMQRWWPQNAPLNEDIYTKYPVEDGMMSIMGFHASLLLKALDKSIKRR